MSSGGQVLPQRWAQGVNSLAQDPGVAPGRESSPGDAWRRKFMGEVIPRKVRLVKAEGR